jgi:exonuclease III
MLDEFLRRQDTDLIFLQEVTHVNITMIDRYTAHMNIGTDGRGTAILVKEGITLTDIQRIPSGRGIVATLNGIRLVRICAPSGSEKKREREAFYNGDVTSLIPPSSTEIILAGDFNCLLSTTDSTGLRNYSKALARLVKRLDLRDALDATPEWRVFTHYTNTSTSRIDRIYVTTNLTRTRQGAEAVAAAFTDHMTIIIRLSLDTPCAIRGKGYWRMNVLYMSEPHSQRRLQESWMMWRQHLKYYLNRLQWWCRYVRRMIQLLFSREGADQRRDRREMENFYYSAIYDALQEHNYNEAKDVILNDSKFG